MFFALIGEYLTKSQNRGSSADKFLTENICFIGRMYKKCNDIFEIIPIIVVKNSSAEKQEKKRKDYDGRKLEGGREKGGEKRAN